MSGQAQRHTPRIRLTGRGAALVMLAVFALGLLGASWLGWPVLAGASFVVGSVAAAWYVRPGDLLTVTITPPLLFGVTLVGSRRQPRPGTWRCPSPRGRRSRWRSGAVAFRRGGADAWSSPGPAACASASVS